MSAEITCPHLQNLYRIPKHHEVANAVGAAIASVSGEVDTIEILQGRSLAEAVEQIKQRAIDEAIRTGAVRGSVGVVDVNILPVQVRRLLFVFIALNLA
jgi:hypothetical protein